jgi:hypothetical protein
LDVAATSTAGLKLHTKRYRLGHLEREFIVLVYRLLYPDISIAKIGDRLQLSPAMKIKGLERAENPKRFQNLESLTGRYLYKAKYRVSHAEQGVFPNASKITEASPDLFGKWAKEFEAKTSRDGEWIAWLRSQFERELIDEVKHKNKLYGLKMVDAKFSGEWLKNFISGEVD